MDMDKVIEKMEQQNINEDTKLYRLCAADLASVLADNFAEEAEKLTGEELSGLVEHVKKGLEIPYYEYMSPLIEIYLDDLKKRKA
ncbi:hypothetical protein [Paenibacillus xylanexedens]|uniref:hypothetical protein n=1 Tax=Paenibacillus xylanexedens TaxID=528191 RepID=UPI0011A72854|nr:hypothetical protein [Paenibacillus xylanexedens]